MDRNFIKSLIANGTPFSKMSKESACVMLNNHIVGVYIKNGLHRQMSDAKFNEEVKFAVAAMYEEISSDKLYRQIRDMEFGYIFSEGMKGRLGSDKDIVITYRNLIRWIEGYCNHAERKEAFQIYEDEMKPKPVLIEGHIRNDDEMRASVLEALNEYVEYRESLKKRASESRSLPKGVMSIGELAGPPISINDYGGYRRKWLVANGYAKDGEKFVDVLNRAIKNDCKLVKI